MQTGSGSSICKNDAALKELEVEEKEMVNIAQIFGYMCMITTGYFFYRLLCCLMEPKKNILIRLLGAYGLILVSSIIVIPQDIYNIALLIPVFLLINWFLFDSNWLTRFSVIMIFYPIIIALNFLQRELSGVIIMNIFKGNQDANVIVSNLVCFIPLIFWYQLWKVVGNKLTEVKGILDKRSWVLLDIICFASMAAVFSCVSFAPEQTTYRFYPCMAACMVTNVGSIYLACYLASSIRTDMERKNLRMQQTYYEELEKNQQQIRKFRHDMKNHFSIIGGLLEDGNIEKARSYFSDLFGYMETRNRKFCENSILNALLNAKYNMAVEAGIDCFFHISFDKMTGIDDISLCTLFSNTLDNAIEACKKVPNENKRKLSLRARYTDNGYFSCEIVNSKVNEVHERKGIFLTDKEDKTSHGLGISSVKEIVEKYKGTLDISYNEEEFQVVVLINYGIAKVPR